MARPRLKRKGGRISRWRIAWAETVLGQFAIVQIPEDERRDTQAPHPEFTPEPGDAVYLHVPGVGDIYVSIELTRCTALELDYIEAIFARAIKLARPICERRDENARTAEQSGDDSYSRIYRQVPQFIVREGHE